MIRSIRAPLGLFALALLGACGGDGDRTPVVGERVPILLTESDVTADAALASIEVLVPPASPAGDWPQPGGDAAKAGGHVALGTSLARAWTANIPGGGTRARLAAAPVVANGRLYAVDIFGTVHAFDAQTGATIWTASTAEGDENRQARFGGGASFDSGRVFATNGLGDVVAFDAATGSQVWRTRPGGPLRGAPTIANGNVYVLSQDNQLFALNQTTGEVVWAESAAVETQGVFGVGAPAAAQGTVVAGFSSGELNAYRYENGLSLWSDTLSRSSISTSVSSLSDIDANPVIDRGRVYAVGQGGRMVALEITSGRRLWEQNLAGISTPWVVGEWIFVVTDEARLLCLQRGSGRIRWITQLRRYRDEEDAEGPIRWSGPVLAGNRLLLINTEGEVVSVAPSDGTVQNRFDTNADLSLPPVVANNTLYLLSEKGRLLAYR